jgi:membrane protein implicated in regulation of membrane protease activity
MANSTIWWVAAGLLVAMELLSGTFYLLMIALGLAAAAVAAQLGAGGSFQFVVAAVVGGCAVFGWHLRQVKIKAQSPAQANVNVNLDIGETVQIEAWNPDGTADVHYRGTRWTAIHRPDAQVRAGAHRVSELIGNRLLVDPI